MSIVSHRVIAIDGPAASGKSSVARELARRLGFVYLNSGSIYRAVTWHLLAHGLSPDDPAGIARALTGISLRCDLGDNQSRIYIDDVDLTPHLRDVSVNRAVSLVSTAPAVRKLADEQMHRCAQTHDLVVEGRDIGSIVFRETPFKFYIDASPSVRARRRAAEGLLDEISARDRADSLRAAAPLVIAEDAEVIDTSDMTIDQVVNEILVRLGRKNFEIGETISTSSAT
jgi:cytidylate kinase